MAFTFSLRTCVFAVTFLGLLSSTAVECKENETHIDRNEMGLEALYDMVNTFLGDVIQTKKISNSFLDLDTVYVDGKFDDDQLTDWEAWLDYLIGFAVCLAIGLAFIVIMPIVGIIFCCCRCCGKCGARNKPTESKRAKCKRRSYCTLVLVFNTITLAGVICAFMCNSLVYDRLQNEDDKGAVGNIKASLNNLNGFIEDSVEDLVVLIQTTADDTVTQANTSIYDAADSAVNSVLDTFNATYYLDEAKGVSAEANDTKDTLENARTLLLDLQTQSTQLKNNLTDIKNDVQSVCAVPSDCLGFNPADFDTDADFSSLGDFADEISKVAATLDMGDYIKEAEQTIDSSRDQASAQVDDAIKGFPDSVKRVQDAVQNGVDELNRQKDQALEFMGDMNSDLDDFNDDIKKYSDYIHYGGIGVCCAFLLVVVCYYVGVLFGLCGERPGHDAPCCNTGAGSNFLMGGVALTFIFSWLLMMLCVILFVLGGPMYTEVCRYFEDHDPSQFKVFDNTLQQGLDLRKNLFDGKPVNFSVSDALRKCQENEAVYSALMMDDIVDIDDYTDLQPLKDEIDSLIATLNVNIGDITILSPDLESSLRKLATSLDGVSFDQYFDEINKQLTLAPLATLASNLSDLALISPEPKKTVFQQSADRLTTLNREEIPSMRQKVATLNTSLVTLQRQSTLQSSILKLIDDLLKAQTDFNANKDVVIKEQIEKVAKKILTDAEDAITLLKSKVRTTEARCRPLSEALYSLSDSVCVLVVDPLNGMWFSFGWCLFFFVPTLIFAILLASQYRREHKFEKEFDDPNYSMYGGPNHDTIPLTRRMDW